MPVESYIRLETEALPISATAAHHEIAVETSVDSGIDLSVSYGDEEGGAWIENLTLADGKLAFDAGENGSSERRIAVISLLYQDEFGRTTEAAVRITQSFSMNPSAATEKDFAFAAALGTGDVEENVYVTGQIVLDGRNANFPNRRYSIQDAEGRALLFESTIDLGVARNDRVRLWLLGSTVKEVAEGTFTYKVFTGIAAEHIMQKEAGSPVQPREVYIRDLTDEMLFSLVRLRDVEIAMPYGGLVNYDEYYVSGGGVNVYGKNLTKYYGTCLRDINGDHLYMLTNFGVDYRRHSLPMGSGTVTGILTREYNSNFGEMGAFQIRHLTQAEIALDPSRENSFSKVLVEWTCVKPAGFKEGVTHVAPTTARRPPRSTRAMPTVSTTPSSPAAAAFISATSRAATSTRTVRVRPIRSRAAVCIRRCGIRTPTGLSATSRPRESVRSCRCRSRPIRCWLPDRAIS